MMNPEYPHTVARARSAITKTADIVSDLDTSDAIMFLGALEGKLRALSCNPEFTTARDVLKAINAAAATARTQGAAKADAMTGNQPWIYAP